MIFNKSRCLLCIRYWFLSNCPCVQDVLEVLIGRNIFSNKYDLFFLGSKSHRHNGHLGQVLIINNLTGFFAWTDLMII